MTKRIILGLVTILAAIPGLLFITVFISDYKASILHWIVLEKITTALFCFTGGGLLFKGNKWGYRLALIGWLLIFWSSSSSILAALQPNTAEQLRTTMLSKEAVFFAVGLTAAIVMIREIIKTKRV